MLFITLLLKLGFLTFSPAKTNRPRFTLSSLLAGPVF